MFAGTMCTYAGPHYCTLPHLVEPSARKVFVMAREARQDPEKLHWYTQFFGWRLPRATSVVMLARLSCAKDNGIKLTRELGDAVHRQYYLEDVAVCLLDFAA